MTGSGQGVLSKRRTRLLARLASGGRGRVREGRVLVEGVRASGEALAADATVRFVVCSPALMRSPAGSALLTQLEERGVMPDWVGEREMAAASATASPQGILLVCEEPSIGLEAMPLAEDGRFLVLDGIQDPGNMGTLIRTARAFGLTAALALDGAVDPWNARVVRASAGSAFRIPVLRAPWSEVREWAAGVQVIVADAGGQDAAALPVKPPWMLVVGNEGAGVRAEIREAAGALAAVPMAGAADSLNAAVAGAVVLYALTRA